MNRRRHCGIGLIVLISLLCGCSGIPEGSETRIIDQTEFLERIEESVSDCMKERGLTYIPFVYEPKPFNEIDVSAEPRSVVEVSGYGYVAWAASQEDVIRDPNIDVIAEMDEEARQEYFDALAGAEGCRWLAEAEVSSEFALARVSETPYDPQADLNLVSWSECMSEGGYHFSEPDEILPYLRGLLAEYSVEPVDPMPFDFDPGPLQVIVSQTYTDYGVSEVGLVEVEIALQDRQCRGGG